ncbi:MAG: hypothetical protein MJ113_04765 [Lachnospiraceae bacterium]|nr:hypothetical protein [Lachnospiraceae bacterium]
MKKYFITVLFLAFITCCFAGCGEDMYSLNYSNEELFNMASEYVNESLSKLEENGYKLSFNGNEDANADENVDENVDEEFSDSEIVKIDTDSERASKLDKLAENGFLITWEMNVSGEYDDAVFLSLGAQGKKYYYSLEGEEEMIYDFSESGKVVVYTRYGKDEKWYKTIFDGENSEKELKDSFYTLFDSVATQSLTYASSMKEVGKSKILGRECAEYKFSEEYLGTKISCMAYVDVETNLVLNSCFEISVLGITEKTENTCKVFDTDYEIEIPSDEEIENEEW